MSDPPNSVASRPISVVVVGAGQVAAQHIAALRTSKNAYLSGVVDIDPQRAESVSRANSGVRWTADIDTALAWSDVDGFIVCTPNQSHLSLGLAIASAGKHLLIEKPLATTLPAAQLLVSEFSERDLVLTVAHLQRSTGYARALKSTVDSGVIGQPRLVRLSVLNGWIWTDWRPWMINDALSGGHALHNGVHLLDLVTWWIDAKPVSVTARGKRATSDSLEIYDYLEMIVDYDNGAVAICEMSRGHRPRSFAHRDIAIVGSEGMITLPWDAEATVVVDENGTSLTTVGQSDPFRIQLESWVDAIRGTTPVMPAQDAALAVALGVAAERSIRATTPIAISSVLEGAA